MRILETIFYKDLENYVSNIISIDEYKSKIDEKDYIVICFFVDGEKQAKDLNRFIFNIGLNIEDSEVSEIPDKGGNYLVFVEIRRNKDFPRILLDLLDILENLVGKKEWKMKIHKKRFTYLVNEKNILELVNIERNVNKSVDKK